MIFNVEFSRLETLRQQAPPFEAKHLHDNLLTLLTKKRSNKLEPMVQAVLKNKPSRLLDIGCGYGALAIFFALNGISVAGIDLEEDRLNAGANLAAILGIQNVTLTKMNACEISLTGFDMALSTDFYEHIPYESQPVHLKAVFQALNSGGRYIIRSPHRSNIRQHRDGHIGLPSFSLLQKQAVNAGFSVQFGIAHTSLVSPFKYHIPVEQWIESRKWSELATYKALQKCGMANVLAHLTKPSTKTD